MHVFMEGKHPICIQKDNARMIICCARRSYDGKWFALSRFSSLCTCKQKIAHELENKMLPSALSKTWVETIFSLKCLCMGFYKSGDSCKVQIDPIYAFKISAWVRYDVQEPLGTQVSSCLLSLSGICCRGCVHSFLTKL